MPDHKLTIGQPKVTYNKITLFPGPPVRREQVNLGVIRCIEEARGGRVLKYLGLFVRVWILVFDATRTS